MSEHGVVSGWNCSQIVFYADTLFCSIPHSWTNDWMVPELGCDVLQNLVQFIIHPVEFIIHPFQFIIYPVHVIILSAQLSFILSSLSFILAISSIQLMLYSLMLLTAS